MCRNIKRLRQPDRLPTDAELHDASLQFVRKISGFRAPSKVNEAAFNAAVRDVAAVGRVLFQSLHVHGHHWEASAYVHLEEATVKTRRIPAVAPVVSRRGTSLGIVKAVEQG